MVVDGVIEQLNIYFPKLDIYDSETEQGFNEPCFFVQQLNKPRKKEIQSYQDTVNLDVQYFLDEYEKNKNEQYRKMGDKLYEILEYITIKNEIGTKKVHGTQMNYEVQDSVLHFYVTYIYYLQMVNDSEKMKSLDIEGEVKDEQSQK